MIQKYTHKFVTAKQFKQATGISLIQHHKLIRRIENGQFTVNINK